VLIFRVLVLHTLCTLSDGQTEYQLRDRLSPPPSADGGPFGNGSIACCDRWADTAYRSAANLTVLARRDMVPHLQRPKPRGKPMPPNIRRGNARRGKVRSAVEHVFAAQKQRLKLVVRTVGIARATTAGHRCGTGHGCCPTMGQLHRRPARRMACRHAIGHVRGAPCHPRPQGRIERWHQTLKNHVLLENSYLPARWRPRSRPLSPLQSAPLP
jgi:hypothetical protein